MTVHVHRRSRLSTPSCSVCDCGAIQIIGHDEWLETTWEPPPLPPLPTPPVVRPLRITVPLPLARAEELERSGWDVLH
jgi:hypothetical protein